MLGISILNLKGFFECKGVRYSSNIQYYSNNLFLSILYGSKSIHLYSVNTILKTPLYVWAKNSVMGFSGSVIYFLVL